MAGNDIAPGFVLIHYSSPFGEHKAMIGCSPDGAIGSVWQLTTKSSGGDIPWTTGIDNYITVAKAMLFNSCVFTYAELFGKLAGQAPVWLDTYSINVAGTNGTNPVPASQVTFSYRDGLGGRGRIEFLDQSDPVNSKYRGPAYGNVAKLAVVAFMLSSTSWVFSRKGGFPQTVPQILTKTNDVLRKKYNLA